MLSPPRSLAAVVERGVRRRRGGGAKTPVRSARRRHHSARPGGYRRRPRWRRPGRIGPSCAPRRAAEVTAVDSRRPGGAEPQARAARPGRLRRRWRREVVAPPRTTRTTPDRPAPPRGPDPRRRPTDVGAAATEELSELAVALGTRPRPETAPSQSRRTTPARRHTRAARPPRAAHEAQRRAAAPVRTRRTAGASPEHLARVSLAHASRARASARSLRMTPACPGT